MISAYERDADLRNSQIKMGDLTIAHRQSPWSRLCVYLGRGQEVVVSLDGSIGSVAECNMGTAEELAWRFPSE